MVPATTLHEQVYIKALHINDIPAFAVALFQHRDLTIGCLDLSLNRIDMPKVLFDSK